MKNIECLNCGFTNSGNISFCKKCMSYLVIQQNTKQIPNLRLYIPTFQTDLFGIMLFDQKQHKDEVFSATRWVFFFIPLFPLTKIIFKIKTIDTIASQINLFRLNVYESRLPSLIEIFSVYLRIAIGLLPIILAVKFGDLIRNNVGFWLTFILFISSGVWFIFVLIRMQNDKIDYQKYGS